MPKVKKGLQSSLVEKFTKQSSFASLLVGGVVVVILGLLVANYFTKRQEPSTPIEEEQLVQEEAVEPQAGEKYTIQEGDSLSKISERVYQNRDLWVALSRVNKIANPNLIYVGAELDLPDLSELKAITEQLQTTNYTVQEGDTLFKIAQKVYGDGHKWVVLDKTNKVGRLSNGNPLIFVGSTLAIPR